MPKQVFAESKNYGWEAHVRAKLSNETLEKQALVLPVVKKIKSSFRNLAIRGADRYVEIFKRGK